MTDRKELAISINQFVRSLVIDPKQKDSARSQYLAIADFIINRERQLRTELVAMTAERDKAVLSNKARDDYDLYCQECGRSHILDTSIPRDIWNKITERDSVGVLCAVCIDKRLTEMGLSCEAEFYYGGDSLNGRCYDSEPHNRKMQAARDRAVSELAENYDLTNSMHKELAAAKQLRDLLVDSFAIYGRHKHNCDVMDDYKNECSCGYSDKCMMLDNALREQVEHE